jgi:hypothetical protein
LCAHQLTHMFVEMQRNDWSFVQNPVRASCAPSVSATVRVMVPEARRFTLLGRSVSSLSHASPVRFHLES